MVQVAVEIGIAIPVRRKARVIVLAIPAHCFRQEVAHQLDFASPQILWQLPQQRPIPLRLSAAKYGGKPRVKFRLGIVSFAIARSQRTFSILASLTVILSSSLV